MPKVAYQIELFQYFCYVEHNVNNNEYRIINVIALGKTQSQNVWTTTFFLIFLSLGENLFESRYGWGAMKLCINCQHRFESKSWNCPNCGFVPERLDGLPIFAPHLISGNESYRVDHYPKLAATEKGHFWFDARNEIIGWHLKRYFPGKQNMLEIGCGTGYVLSYIQHTFPHMTLSGSDVHTQGLAYARQRVENVELMQMDACRMPFENEFSLVGAFDVLEHIEMDGDALARIFTALKQGGGCLISVPQHKWLWSVQDEAACHKRRYTRNELIEKMKAAGFRIIKATSFLSLLLPVMLISRISKNLRRGSNPPAFNTEIQLSSTLNRYFKAISRLENFLIRRGVSFPVGGTLFVAAKKEC